MAKSQFTVMIFILALLGALLSGAIHEIGHIVAGKFAGLDIVDFQLWFVLGRAQVRFSGATTPGWYAVVNIAGVVASVSCGLVGLIALRGILRLRPSWIVGAFLFIPMVCQSLAWLVLPVVLALGGRAPHDDVIMFIRNSGWGHIPVALVGLVLVTVSALGVFLIYRKGKCLNQSACCEKA